MPSEGRELWVAISSEETCSDTQRSGMQGNEFREENCWIHRDPIDDSPLGEPGAGKLHAGIYWGRASQGARLPTKDARPVLWGAGLARDLSTRPFFLFCNVFHLDASVDHIFITNLCCFLKPSVLDYQSYHMVRHCFSCTIFGLTPFIS